MASVSNKSIGKPTKATSIDPIYKKFTKSVIRALGSTDFYDFFMDSISGAENEIQFSNRKMVKTVDVTWVDAIESSLDAFQSIISNPRNIINEEELIVNVANAKKGGSEVVRHLAQHASLVEDFKPESGEVRPSRLMQKFREDSIGLYENRLVYTVMEMAHQFVKIRHDALFSAMSDEFGAKLKLNSTMQSATELVHMDMFLHIKEIEGALETDSRNREVFERISRMHRVLSVFMTSQFAQQMAKLPRIKGTVTKTNVLKKNTNYKRMLALWEFLHEYEEIGYTIRVIEQNPEVSEILQRDIYHNIMFNYLVLKGYLEDEKDRQVKVETKSKQKTLKPRFIREIIEELTEDYDLPDVEIRKVLIEELTKEQLMQEEAAERRRLVEEQARRKKEEEDRIRREQEEEKARIRAEREAEKERIRQEKAAEEERLYNERMEREAEERRRSKIFNREIAYFRENLEKQLEARQTAEAKKAAEMQDFADAAQILEEAEQRKIRQAERERKRLKEERDRIRREKQLAEKRAMEEERARKEAERKETERLKREQEEKDTAGTQAYYEELLFFMGALPEHINMRADYTKQAKKERNIWEAERKKRQVDRAKVLSRQ